MSIWERSSRREVLALGRRVPSGTVIDLVRKVKPSWDARRAPSGHVVLVG